MAMRKQRSEAPTNAAGADAKLLALLERFCGLPHLGRQNGELLLLGCPFLLVSVQNIGAQASLVYSLEGIVS
jgi:hypothetical protein